MPFDYEKSIWGRGSAGLRWSSPSAFRLRQALLILKNLPAGSRVLEAGCGAGQFIRAIKKIRPELENYGCDISAVAIEEAWSKRDEVQYHISKEKALPYNENFFDAVMVLDVLEHASDPPALLAEIHRTLKPGGVLYTFVPCEGDWLSYWHWLDKLGLKKDITRQFAGHINYFSRRALARLYGSSGFIIKRKRYSEHVLGQIAGIFSFYLMRRKSRKMGLSQMNNEQFFASLGSGAALGILKKIINSAIYLESLIFSIIPSPNAHWTMIKK